MLEPLGAFALACNLLQIVEYGAKILTKAIEYRNAADGTLVEQQNLYGILQSLKGLNSDIEASMPRPSHADNQSAAESRLIAANEDCLRLSEDFINFLDRLKVNNKRSMLESLRLSIKSVWYKERLENMKNALSQARDNLNIAFLVYMEYANTTMQYEILRSNDEAEARILDTFALSSKSISDEIKLLTAQMQNYSIGSIQDSFAEFRASNQDFLDQLSQQLHDVRFQQDASEVVAQQVRVFAEVTAAQQKILETLHFPQLHERRNHIPKAHKDTYTWILQLKPDEHQRWDNFVHWAGSKNNGQRLYWIRGKPGCGKTTLMRFLDETINMLHLSPWVETKPLIKARCFFWNPGNQLQKSLAGLLRSLLFQLLEQTPGAIPRVVPVYRWRRARSAHSITAEWATSELLSTIREFVSLQYVNVFVLIDGLDEFDGTDEQREELIDLLNDLAAFENVKLCVSSRSWNIFQDAFAEFPQLRLEDLTHDDISHYVREQLSGNRRFQHLSRHDASKAESLVSGIVNKASGVFLWVRLVVRELLKALRDGDGIRTLVKKLDDIPADLDAYFTRLMESIEEQHRQEAAVLLQIALHDEEKFTSLHPLRVIDMSFIEEERPDFALDANYIFGDFDIADVEGIRFRIDSTIRRLNSRCMGLLECHQDSAQLLSLLDLDDVGIREHSTSFEDYQDTEYAMEELYDPLVAPAVPDSFHFAFDLTVDFLHRSFRDFLLTHSSQTRLREYAREPYDARLFLCNARLVQLRALRFSDEETRMAIGLASYLLSAVSISELKEARVCAEIAAGVQPVIESIMDETTVELGSWYITTSLAVYHQERSTFLTVAIDFDLQAFVETNLTSDAIRNKQGRPILDYVLRGRFGHVDDPIEIGNQHPNVALLTKALELGADPDQDWNGVPLLALFMCYLIDENYAETPPSLMIKRSSDPYEKRLIAQRAHVAALRVLLQYGADPVLPKQSLCHETDYTFWGGNVRGRASVALRSEIDGDSRETMDTIFERRWKSCPILSANGGQEVCAVADLLKELREGYAQVAQELQECISLAVEMGLEKHSRLSPSEGMSREKLRFASKQGGEVMARKFEASNITTFPPYRI